MVIQCVLKLFHSFQNAWVKQEMDTRNVGVHEVIVEVEDLPDTPPYFLIAPPVTRLAETATIVSVNSLLMLGFKHFIS